MRKALVLIALILMAGCTSQDSSGKQTSGEEGEVFSDELSLLIEGLPSEIGDDKVYFRIAVEAAEPMENVEVILSSAGSYLKSSCFRTNTLRDFDAGERKELACSIEKVGSPPNNTEQEILYSAKYKLVSYSGELEVEVYDSSEEGGHGQPKTLRLGPGEFRVDNSRIEEGEEVDLTLLIGGALAKGDSCGCNIEKAVVKIPRGFVVTAASNWQKTTCGDFSCYEDTYIDTAYESHLVASIPGVVRTETFSFGAELHGIWKELAGSVSVSVT